MNCMGKIPAEGFEVPHIGRTFRVSYVALPFQFISVRVLKPFPLTRYIVYLLSSTTRFDLKVSSMADRTIVLITGASRGEENPGRKLLSCYIH